jgi:hypothetical protein
MTRLSSIAISCTGGMTQRPCLYSELICATLFRYDECLVPRERQRKINTYEDI